MKVKHSEETCTHLRNLIMLKVPIGSGLVREILLKHSHFETRSVTISGMYISWDAGHDNENR